MSAFPRPRVPPISIPRMCYEKLKYSILAQVESELGDPEVEAMLNRFASWSEEEFLERLTVKCGCQGHVGREYHSGLLYIDNHSSYDDVLCVDWTVFWVMERRQVAGNSTSNDTCSDDTETHSSPTIYIAR